MSLVTKVRKDLGIKGKSRHNGRGQYDMERTEDITFDEVYDRLQYCISKWREEGIVVDVHESVDEYMGENKRIISIEFDPDVYGHYRCFHTNEVMVDEFGSLGGVSFMMMD